jgi:hypothetical protein
MLSVVWEAVEQFRREQKANPTLARHRAYRRRYGFFPPDELELFTPVGIPGGPPGTRAPGGAVVVPAPGSDEGYDPMNFYTKGLPPPAKAAEFRDQVAMVVAIQMFGDVSSSILDRIEGRYWLAPLDDKDDPAVFLDRPAGATPPDGTWDANAHQVRYIVDGWGNPISYLSQRDWKPPPDPPAGSTNLPANPPATGGWNQAATRIVRLNGGQPVIFSYGPNGKEQLTREQMEVGGDGVASLVGDFLGLSGTEGQIDNPLNADNVYADPTLKVKLAKGGL